MPTYHFSNVAVYAEIGGALRLARNARVQVTDPTTGAPVNVTQGGVTGPYLTTSPQGIAEFTAETWPVRLTSGAVFEDVPPVEAAQEMRDAILVATAPTDTAVATAVANPSSNTRTALDDLYVPLTDVGAPDGLATLDATGKIPDTQLPAANGDGSSPLTLSRLPGYLNNTYCWNGVAFIQDNVVTVTDGTGQEIQYAVWVNDAQHAIIGKRSMPNGAWSTFDLFAVAPFNALVTNDVHNSFSIGVDGDGHIHVSGDMHAVGLKYLRSTNPWSIAAWTTAGAPSTFTTQATYPMFLRVGGDLVFTYRDGVSGAGDWVIHNWNRATKVWANGRVFIQGKPTSENPYPHRMTVEGTDGANPNRVHMMWDWRTSSNADTNNDPCYAYSDDLGATWRNSNGTAYTLPITHATAEKAVTTGTSTGMHAMGGFDVDINGRPHYANVKYDAGGNTQLWHVWHNGTAWVSDLATTDLDYRMDMSLSISGQEVGRPAVVCTRQGKTLLLWRSNYTGRRGRLWVKDVTEGGGNPKSWPLLDMDLFYFEPTYDLHALRRTNTLHMLITPLALDPNSKEFYHASLWSKQAGWVLTADLDRLGFLTVAQKPTVEQTSVAHIPTTSLTTTLSNDLGVAQTLVSAESRREGFARMIIRGDPQSGTGVTVNLVEHTQFVNDATSIADSVIASLTFTATRIWATPWVPLAAIGKSQVYGWLSIGGQSATSGQGRISFGRVELGRLAP